MSPEVKQAYFMFFDPTTAKKVALSRTVITLVRLHIPG